MTQRGNQSLSPLFCRSWTLPGKTSTSPATSEKAVTSPKRRPLRATRSFNPPRPATGLASLLPTSLQPNPSVLDQSWFDGDDLFDADMEKLSYSNSDTLAIVNEDEAFRTLKASLRKRGCVTNGYLKENFHFYVAHVKDVKDKQEKRSLRREAELAATETRSSQSGGPPRRRSSRSLRIQQGGAAA